MAQSFKYLHWLNQNKKRALLYFLFFFLSYLIFWPIGRVFPDDYSTIVYDRHGTMLSVFLNKREQWHFPPHDTLAVPAKLKTCVTQFEDRFFDYHPGINPVALARAAWQNISAGKVVSGASTVTMQVARISDPKPRTFYNKLKEMLFALRLELWRSKDQILKLYLNQAPYGGNTVGYRAASWRYFGKEPTALTWAEAATLAVLPNAPGLISPQSSPQKLVAKRNRLLQKLKSQNIITLQDLTLARLEAVPQKVFDLPFGAPHFSMAIRQRFTGQGRQVYSSINLTLQNRAEETIAQHASYLQKQGVANVAAIICNTQTGEIIAYVGSQDFWDKANNGMVDGVRAPRSSGSILKPLLYALSMDDGLILPATKIRDIPTFYGPFSPSNADEKFRGLVTAQTALVHSFNIPAVRLLNTFGYADFYEYLKLTGLKHLFRRADDYGLPLILGGAEVTLWEMAQMYRGIALGGVFENIHTSVIPNLIRTPLNQNDNLNVELAKDAEKKNKIKNNPSPVILSEAERREESLYRGDASFLSMTPNVLSSYSRSLFSEVKSRFQSGRSQRLKISSMENQRAIVSQGASYLTLQMLKELHRPGSEFYWQQYQNQWPLAWKTGTSYGQRDAWAIGTSPQWTIAVWAGNFTGEGNPELAGSRSAGPVLFDLFNMLPKNKSLRWFQRPESELADVRLCAWSGYLATEHCPKTVIADAPRLMKTMRLCPWHRTLFVDDQEKYEVCSLCWQEGKYHQVKKLVLPADINQYLRGQSQLVDKIPPHNPACPAEHSATVLEIVYPTEKARIWVPRDYDGQYQKITVRAAHRQAGTKIFWYLDGFYMGATIEKHVKSLSLENGWHKLALVDENGRRAERSFFSGKN